MKFIVWELDPVIWSSPYIQRLLCCYHWWHCCTGENTLPDCFLLHFAGFLALISPSIFDILPVIPLFYTPHLVSFLTPTRTARAIQQAGNFPHSPAWSLHVLQLRCTVSFKSHLLLMSSLIKIVFCLLYSIWPATSTEMFHNWHRDPYLVAVFAPRVKLQPYMVSPVKTLYN